MSRSSILTLTLALLIAGAAGSNAAAADAPVTVSEPRQAEARAITPQEAAAETRALSRPVYGPITSKDPAIRAQVKRLYQERARLHDDTRARLAELAVEIKAEADPDFRWELNQEIAQLKKDLELHSVELGLQIAQLNEDARRVAELEHALDQMRNPEKYRPAPVDPSVQQERIRAMQQEADGGAR